MDDGMLWSRGQGVEDADIGGLVCTARCGTVGAGTHGTCGGSGLFNCMVLEVKSA